MQTHFETLLNFVNFITKSYYTFTFYRKDNNEISATSRNSLNPINLFYINEYTYQPYQNTIISIGDDHYLLIFNPYNVEYPYMVYIVLSPV